MIKKILVIDDDEFLRDLYVSTFRGAGLEVISAADGLKGLDLATSQNPDIVFTGITMPGLTGFELIEKLKSNPATASIPIVIFSHMGKPEHQQKAAELGASGFLVKGLVSPKQAVEFVNHLLNERVWKVAVDTNQYDGQKLAQYLNKNGQIVIELIAGEDEKGQSTFKAKVV